MSKFKLKKSSLFSRLLAASIICGTALGFTGEAFAGGAPEINPLYTEGRYKNVFAAGSGTINTGVFADNGGFGFVGKNAISLTVGNYAVYANVAADAEYGVELELGDKAGGNTNFIVLTAANGIYAQGRASTNAGVPQVETKHDAKVETYGDYLGIDATDTGVKADAYGNVNLNSENIVISATGENSVGLVASGTDGKIIVNGNLFVNAVTAVAAYNGGHIEINQDKEGTPNTNVTVLKGNIESQCAPQTIKAKLYGKDSSWTGNVTLNGRSNIEFGLVNGATWNVTAFEEAQAVTTLTMTDGFMEMRDNQGGGTAATANVTTLAGTKGIAHLDDNDILKVGTISNSDLTVYGGQLGGGIISNGAVVNLNDVDVVNTLTVSGTLNGKDVEFGDNATLYVGNYNPITSGTATFNGFTTGLKNVVVRGSSSTDKGSLTLNAKETAFNNIDVNSYGEVTANGNVSGGTITVSENGEATLQGNTTKIDDINTNQGTLTVASNLTTKHMNFSGDKSVTTINEDGKHTTRVDGKIEASDKAEANIYFTGKESVWTGNVANNAGTLNMTFADGAKWNTADHCGGAVDTLTLNRGIISMKNQTTDTATDPQEAATAQVITLTGTDGIVTMDYNDTLEVTNLGKTEEELNLNVIGGVLKVGTVNGTVNADFFGTNITGINENSGLTVAGTLTANNAYVTANTLDVKGGTLNANNSFVTTTVNVGDVSSETATYAGTATFGGFMSIVNNLNAKGVAGETPDVSTVEFNAMQNYVGTMTADANSTITANGNLRTQNVVAKDGGLVELNGGFTSVYNATANGVGLYAYSTGTGEDAIGGTITVNSNLFVNAATALKATNGGHIEINWDADDAETPNTNITVLKGNIEGENAPHTIKVQLTGEDSYWTGNVTESDNTDIQFRLYDRAIWNVAKVKDAGTVDTLALEDGVVDMTGAWRATAKVTTLTGTEGIVYMDGEYNKNPKRNSIDTLEVSVFDVDDLTIYDGVLKVVADSNVDNDCTIQAGDALTLYGTRITGDTLTVEGELDGKDITAKADIIATNGGVVDLYGHGIDVNNIGSFTDAGVPSIVRIHADEFKADDLMTGTSYFGETGDGLIGVNGGTATVDYVVANGGKIALQSEQTSADMLAAFGGTIDVVSNLEVDGGKLPSQFHRVYSGNASIISANGGNVNVNTDGLDKTTLNGDIFIYGGNVKVNLKGAEKAADTSSWTGNMVSLGEKTPAYNADITIGENSKWNVTTVKPTEFVDVVAVTNLTMNGGTVSMRGNNARYAVAKVETLSGTSGLVDMSDNSTDTFVIGTNTNENLTIKGNNKGTLEGLTDDTITNTGVMNLNGITVNAKIANGKDADENDIIGTINVIGGTTTANYEITNMMNVAKGATLKIGAGNVGNTIANAGTTNLTGGTLSNTITGGTIQTTGNVSGAADKFAGDFVNITDGTTTLTGGTKFNPVTFTGGSLRINNRVKIGDSNTSSYVAMDMTNVTGKGELSVSNGSRLYISGTLNHDIEDGNSKNGTTVLAEDIHVTSSKTIGTALRGEGKTIDMTNGDGNVAKDVFDTLTIGKLTGTQSSKTVNLKIDVATGGSSDLKSDKLTVNAAESGATINLTSVNITRDGQTSKTWTPTYVDGADKDKITYKIADDKSGTLYTYTSNYLYTIGSSTKGQLSITRASEITAGEVVKTALTDSRNATLSLTEDRTKNTEGDISVKGTKEIYLNGKKLKSDSDSTITVSGSSTTLNIIGGRTSGTTGTIDEHTNFVIKTNANLNISGYTKIEGDITNDSKNCLNILDGVVTTNGVVTGTGKATVANGVWIANSTLQQSDGVELKDNSKLEINAKNLQSDVTYGGELDNGGTVQLTGGTLKDDYTIAVETVELGGNVTVVSADSLENDILLMKNNKITLKGGDIKGGMTIVGGGTDAKIIVDGAVGAEDAGDLTVNVDVNTAPNSLTLYSGTLADGVIISGKGKLVTDSADGVTARVQDIQVKNGIENKQELILTGNGKLATNIYGDGDLTIAGTVDAGNKKINQGNLTVDNNGNLTVNVNKLTIDEGAVTNYGELILTGDGELNEKISGGTGTTVIAGKIDTEKTIKNNIKVNEDAAFIGKGLIEGNIDNYGTMSVYSIYVINDPYAQQINGTIRNNEGATLNLSTKYTNDTAILNAGTLNVDVANLKADVTNSLYYPVDHDWAREVSGTVNLNGKGTLTNKVSEGTLNVNGNITATADNVAADNTYVADKKTLTLTGGTLVGEIDAADGYNGKVVINGNVVAEDYIGLATTVKVGKTLTIDADNVGANITLKNDTEDTKHGRLLLGEGTLNHTVTGGKIVLEGDVSTDAGNLVENELVRLNSKVLNITGGTLKVAIGSEQYKGGTLEISGVTNANKAIWTAVKVDEGATFTVGAAKLKADKLVTNDGTLNLKGNDVNISREITGAGILNINGILTTENAITQRVVNIGAEKSLTMKGENADLTATYAVVNAGTLTVDAANLKAVVANASIMNLGEGTIDKMICGALVENAIVLGTTNITGDVTSNGAIYQNTVNIQKNNTLTMNADLYAAGTGTFGEEGYAAGIQIANGATLAINAWNLKGDVDIIVGVGDQKAKNGKVELGAGVLSQVIRGANIQLTDNVKTVAGNLKENKLVDLNEKVLIIDGGDLAVNIGSAANDTGTLVTTETVSSTKKIYTDLVNDGTLTADVANIIGDKKLENNGIMTLNGGTAAAIAREITGIGMLNLTGSITDANDVTQGIVKIAQGADLTMTAMLTAADYVYVAAGEDATETAEGTLTIDADNMKGVVYNLGTMNLGEGTLVKGIIGVDPTDNNPSVENAAGTLNITGDVISEAAIAQKVIKITTGKTLTMNSNAYLYATDNVEVAVDAVLKIAAADLYGNVVLAKAAEPAEGEEAKANGKIELGTGTLFKTITGGDVELTGNVTTEGGNLINGTDNDLTVNLAGQNLYISKGDLDVVINNTTVEGAAAESGALVIQGETTAKKDINAAVGVAATGAFTVDANKLTGSKAVINYGGLTLTGGTLAREIEGTGTTTINGAVVANDYIWQNKVEVINGSSLDMNDLLLANVDIKAGGAATVSATKLKGAVANAGTLTLEDGTYAGLDETYAGFVASINGTGTLNINGTASTGVVASELVINQGTVNVKSGTFDMDSKLTVSGTTTVDSGAKMYIDADNLISKVTNSGIFYVENDEKGSKTLIAGSIITNNAGGEVNIADGLIIKAPITNAGTVNVNVVNGTGVTLNGNIANTGSVNTNGKVTMTGDFTGHTGTVYVKSGTFIFNNTKEGSFDNNAEISAGATMDPLARTLYGNVNVNDYGTLIIEKPKAGEGDDYLAANIIADGKDGEGIIKLEAGTLALKETGTITQKNNAVLKAVDNAADKAVITNVNNASQLNISGGILELTGIVGGEIAKNQQYALVSGDAVKNVVAQDLLNDRKLWKNVVMNDGTNTVSNIDSNAKFLTDYFLGANNTIVAEVRTIKSIDEINTNGLAGVQQGALAMTNQMNDKVAENMSLTLRPAAEKDQKYGKQIWASYINTKEDVDERDLWNLKADNSAKYKGAIVGVDFYSSKKAIAGIALSYATGDITANTANRTHVQNDSKYYGVTLYDRVTNGNVAWTYDLGYQRGKNEISMNARENITADVKTNAITAGIRVERAYKTDKNSTFAPFASVRYTRLNTGDYTNSNGSEFDTDNQNLFIPKFGVAWKGDYGDSVKGWAFNPVVEVGFMFNAGSRSAETQYLSSTGNMFNAEYDVVDSSTYYGRVGMNFVNKKFSVGMDYRYLKGITTKNSRWNINLGWSF